MMAGLLTTLFGKFFDLAMYPVGALLSEVMGISASTAMTNRQLYDRWRRLLRRHPHCLQFLVPWVSSVRSGRTPLEGGYPWVTFPATRWLERALNPGMVAFEWGSGGSTLFISRRVARLISVEHEREWFEVVRGAIGEWAVDNCEYELVEPETRRISADPLFTEQGSYASGHRDYEGRSFEEYVTYIDRFPDGHFDFILIDGRARMDCIRHGCRKVRPGGAIMLDNSDYRRYQPALSSLEASTLKSWQRTDLFGPGPHAQCVYWRTTVWQRTGQGRRR